MLGRHPCVSSKILTVIQEKKIYHWFAFILQSFAPHSLRITRVSSTEVLEIVYDQVFSSFITYVKYVLNSKQSSLAYLKPSRGLLVDATLVELIDLT